MEKISKYSFLLGTGGSLYYGFEVLFRGFSHWTMFLLGGICFLFLYMQGNMIKFRDSLAIQVIRGIIFITSMEFITGIIVNKWLKLNVWDYSRLPLHLFGQICVPFIIIFSGLCALGIILCGYIDYRLYGEEKPDFHVL